MTTVDAVQTAAVVASLAFTGYQLMQQRRALNFDIYQRITDRFSDILWKAAEDPRLNAVWFPLQPDVRRKLEAGGDPWSAMDAEQRTLYRYTRLVLEALEETHEAHELGLIGDDVWQKWCRWVDAWIGSSYFDYVVDLDQPQPDSPFQDSFIAFLRQRRQARIASAA